MPERSLRQLLPWALLCVVLCAPGLWLLKQDRCGRWCDRAVQHGDELSARDPLAALRQLDRVDAVCDCMDFTEGDEPPEHAAARRWVRDAELREPPEALGALRPRGAIVRGLLGR